MRRTASPPWAGWAVEQWEQGTSFPKLAEALSTQDDPVPWHLVRRTVHKHRTELGRGAEPREAQPLLPWVMPAHETGAYVAPRLRLVVRRHRGDKLDSLETARADNLLEYMERFGAEVIRWDGAGAKGRGSWELRARREDDEGFDPEWYPPLIVK